VSIGARCLSLVLAVAGVSAFVIPPAAATASGLSRDSAPSPSGWVSDSVRSLDIFNPDADSVYFIDGYGTENGARTVIHGRVPDARYWSFTGYPVPSKTARVHVHDTNIRQSRGSYTVTLSTSCAGVRGTCLATGAGHVGILVMRLYVPVDITTTDTGGVPLPTVHYLSTTGRRLTLTQSSGTSAVGTLLDLLRAKQGTLPAALTKSYPPAAPVPTPVLAPPPLALVAAATGPFANPDNDYEHLSYTTTRGDLVVTADAPTYRSSPSAADNNLARSAPASSQVRYWSLCIDLKGGYTGACLRDQQIRILNGSRRFVVVVAPTCPVAGYANCLDAGPEPLQRTLLYRNLLPSPRFARVAFTGAYGLTATYVARPG
jgi:hypothetical protein